VTTSKISFCDEAASAGAGQGLTLTGRTQSSCLRFSEAEFVDHLLAHDELLHLAGDSHWEGVDKLDVARDLVVGDLVFAELLDLRRRRGHARLELDPRAPFNLTESGD
jgi:hypothetical protein